MSRRINLLDILAWLFVSLVILGFFVGMARGQVETVPYQEYMAFRDSVYQGLIPIDGGGTTPPPPPPVEPPPTQPPPQGSNFPIDRDPPQMVSTSKAKLVYGGVWDGWFTGSPGKLDDDGSNGERNASCKPIGVITGQAPDELLNQGTVFVQVKINEDGLETGGGGKHLLNLASTPLSRGHHNLPSQTRVEIANPGDRNPRFVLHNYVQGQGGARELGKLPIEFKKDRYQLIKWSWRYDPNTRFLEMTCCGGSSDKRYTATLREGSEGPGRYWGPGHMETDSGGGRFWFDQLMFTER